MLQQILTSLIGGAAAWFLTMHLGQPYYQFLGLRFRAAQALATYGSVTNDQYSRTAWKEAAEAELLDCGSQLLALAVAEPVLIKALERLRGYEIEDAGERLLQLAAVSQGDPSRRGLVKAIRASLRFS